MLGTAARVFTTLQEVNDYAILSGFVVAVRLRSLLNVINSVVCAKCDLDGPVCSLQKEDYCH